MGFKALKDVITKTLLSGTEKVFINDNGVTKQTAITNFMITDPEHAGNKVTSLDSFSNDKQYPSAKCVYDELQKKQDKEPFVVKVDGNSEDGYTSNYTISEIYEAYSAGQRVICKCGIIECIPIYIEQATALFTTTVSEGSIINVFITITSGNIQILEMPLQSKLTAGHNIDIDEDGIISASFDGLDSLPTSISNAMDTDGFGWTETKDYIGIDVQWDGNTEGLENVDDVFYKIADLPDEVTSLQDIPDALVTLDVEGQTMAGTIYGFASTPYDNSDVIVLGSIFGYIILADTTYEGFQFKRGIYSTSAAHSIIITRIYQESGSEEVVHQIDQKYIPGIPEAPVDGKQYARKDGNWSEVVGGSGGGAMVVNFTPTQVDGVFTLLADKTPAEVKSAMLSGAVVGTILFPFATEISPIGCAMLTADLLIGFVIVGLDDRTLTMKYMITCDESFTEWILHQG